MNSISQLNRQTHVRNIISQELTTSDHDVISLCEKEIGDLIRRGQKIAFKIGERASRAKMIFDSHGLARGRGSVYGEWVAETFEASYRTIERMRGLYEAFVDLVNEETATAFIDNVSLSAGYLLSFAPIDARVEAVNRAVLGEQISRETARRILGEKTHAANETHTEVKTSAIETTANDSPQSNSAPEIVVTHEESTTASSPSVSRFTGPKSDEWRTPKWLVDSAFEFFGGEIGTDPASDSATTPNVSAENVYTIADDGLQFVWHGSVWLNPPFSKLREFVSALLAHYQAGQVTEALLVGPTYTSSAWFLQLVEFPRVHFTKRVAYVSPDDPKKSSPNFDSTLFYIGDDIERFNKCFGQPSGHGHLYIPYADSVLS